MYNNNDNNGNDNHDSDIPDTPNLPANIIPTNIAGLKLSRKFPLGLGN